MAKVSKSELVQEIFIFLDDRGVEDASELATEMVDELLENVTSLESVVKDDEDEDEEDEVEDEDIEEEEDDF